LAQALLGREAIERSQYARTSDFCEMRAPVQFVVLKRADKWVVKWQDAERAFPRHHKAVEAAIKLAYDSGKNGKPAVVLFQKTKTDFRKIWTYGESAYPLTKSDLSVLAQLMQPQVSGR
jgi:hypothetical protein